MLQLLPDAELQVKPEPEDTSMATEAAPDTAPTAGQPVKAEPPTQAPANPNTDVSGASVQQGGAAHGGSAAAPPSNISAMPHAGSLTPESSAQVVYAKGWGCTEVQYLYISSVSHCNGIRVFSTVATPRNAPGVICRDSDSVQDDTLRTAFSPLSSPQSVAHAVLRTVAVPMCSFAFLPPM